MFGFFAAVSDSRMHQRPFFTVADKANHLADARLVGELASDAFNPLGESIFAEKQLAIGAP